MEKGTPESASLWRAKGITPIEFEGFDEIYQTLTEWACYATLLEKITETLRPKLKLGKRIFWGDEVPKLPETPSEVTRQISNSFKS